MLENSCAILKMTLAAMKYFFFWTTTVLVLSSAVFFSANSKVLMALIQFLLRDQGHFVLRSVDASCGQAASH